MSNAVTTRNGIARTTRAINRDVMCSLLCSLRHRRGARVKSAPATKYCAASREGSRCEAQGIEKGSDARRRQTVQGVEKGPVARRRPKVAREAYSLYVERAAEGAPKCNYVWVANGPLSAACYAERGWRSGRQLLQGERPTASAC